MLKRQKIQQVTRPVTVKTTRASQPLETTSITQQTKKYKIRWMLPRDLASVLEIECQSFEFSWTKEDFADCLRRRNCVGMVATDHDRVVGFMIYELSKRRIELINFGVAPGCRRSGVGTQMTQKLIGKLARPGRTRITFPLRERNLEAQLFFRSLGFRAVSILHKFYENTEEDAYLMQYQVPPRWAKEVRSLTVNSMK
ncbi:MAG: ribosomal protein S18-alanine N-acetyltransferase [Thermoguttaceae bacterium]|nr:ribosomal protein S18-alanine N-acetyltransferase [Thermoguttaceae bacterium]